MSNENHQPNDHDLGDVWTAVRRQGEAIAEIRQGLSSIADALSDFRTEIRNVRELTTRPQQPTNWLGVAALCVTILIAGGGYAKSVIEPVKEDANQAIAWQAGRSASLVTEHQVFGNVEQMVRNHNDWLQKLEGTNREVVKEVATMQGQMEMVRERLEDVDLGGSRKWVNKDGPR